MSEALLQKVPAIQGFAPRAWRLRDGTALQLRAVRPDDAAGEQALMHALSAESRYARFLTGLVELPPDLLSRFTAGDDPRHVGLVVTRHDAPGHEEIIADGRYVIVDSGRLPSADLAVAVADRWQGRGIGRRLIAALLQHAREHGVARMTGDVLQGNRRMLGLMRDAGFEVRTNARDRSLVRVERVL